MSAEAKTKVDDKVRRPLTMRRFLERYALGIVAILASIVVFIVPFAFIFLMAKDRQNPGMKVPVAISGYPERQRTAMTVTMSRAKSVAFIP